MLQEHKLERIVITITGKNIEVSQLKSGVDESGTGAEIDLLMYQLLDLLLDAGYSINLVVERETNSTQPN